MNILNDPWELLGMGLACLALVPELILLMLCWVHRRLSRWIGLVLAGFALSLATRFWGLTTTLAVNLQLIRLSDPPYGLQLLFLIGQAAGLLAILLIAVGLALVFRDIRRRLESCRIEILRLSRDQA